MKLNELQSLIKEVIKEQQEADLRNHPNRSVASYFRVMLRQPSAYHQQLADLYDIMIVSDKASSQDRAEEMGFTRGLVGFHHKGLKGDSNLPTGTQLLAAAQSAVQARKDAAAAAQAEGRFTEEIAPIAVPPRFGRVVDTDNHQSRPKPASAGQTATGVRPTRG